MTDYSWVVLQIKQELQTPFPSVCPILHILDELYGSGATGELNTHRGAYSPVTPQTSVAFWEYNFDLLCLILADLGEL